MSSSTFPARSLAVALVAVLLTGVPATATPTPVPPPASGGPDCVNAAFARPIPAGERQGVVLVESRVELFASEAAAEADLERTIRGLVDEGGIDHSEDAEARRLGAAEVTILVPGAGSPLLVGVGAFRDGRVVHTLLAAKGARTGGPMGVSDDVFAVIEAAQAHRGGSLAERVLREGDLDGGWTETEPEVLGCAG